MTIRRWGLTYLKSNGCRKKKKWGRTQRTRKERISKKIKRKNEVGVWRKETDVRIGWNCKARLHWRRKRQKVNYKAKCGILYWATQRGTVLREELERRHFVIWKTKQIYLWAVRFRSLKVLSLLLFVGWQRGQQWAWDQQHENESVRVYEVRVSNGTSAQNDYIGCL